MNREIGDLFIWLFTYRTDRFLIAVLCMLIFFILLNYSRITTLKRGKGLFWIAGFSVAVGIGLTAGVYLGRLPHGLPGNYYANALWKDDGTELERFFETNGKRVDRFIDFHPNDFNSEYPFSWQPFSVRWQGYVYLPDDSYQLGVTSNFGTWLYIDDVLVEGHHSIDFGTPEARTYLREGWSYDEWWGAESGFSFIWSSENRSEFYLGVDEVTYYRFIFRCLPFVYEGSPHQELTVSIAERPIGSVILQEGWHTYDMSVPRSLLQDLAPGFFRVKFSYSHVVRPSEVLKQSQETRSLAVAFDFAMLQKISSHEGKQSQIFPQEVPPQKPFSPKGIHSVTLKALTNQGKDSFIQLVWQQRKNPFKRVIPEDYLFPETLLPDEISQALSKERIWLGVSIVYKIVVVVFLGSLMTVSLLRSLCFRKLFRWDVLILIAIGIFAFGIRLLFIFEKTRINPHFEILPAKTDYLTYVIYARGFFRGYWPRLFHAPFHGAPLISFYFIVCAILFGEDLLITRIMTALLAMASVFLTFGIARQTFNRPVAYIAAVMCACNGVLLFYDTSLLIAPLLTFFSLLSVYFIGKLSKRLSVKTTILLGISLGLTALARSNIFLIMPFLFLWIMFYFPGKFLHKIGYYILLCLVMLLTILPVTIRNYYSNDSRPFVLTNGNGGHMLWLGNNPSANGGPWYSEDLLQETRNRMEKTGSTFVGEVFRYIQEHPSEWLKLEYRKFILFWRGYEISNLLPYYAFRYNSKILRLPWVNFVLVGPLGVTGMILALRKWKACFILYSYVFIQMLTTIIFHALARYRIPVVPVLSIFAAYTVWYSIQVFQKKQWYKLGITIGVFIVLYLVMNYPHAAYLYQKHNEEPMPLSRIPRYWDLFYTL